MGAPMREADTQLIPYAPWEVAWARERPAQHRTPLPAPGDEVRYRHDYWGPVVRAEVVSVQPLDDLTDPNLWTVELDGLGNPLQVDGRALIAQKLDPWPTLHLRVPGLGVGHLAGGAAARRAGLAPPGLGEPDSAAAQFTAVR
jgi:hypothetical protein